jgi:hypothetical protein
MAFQPKLDIVEVPRNSEWLLIKDATLPYNATTNPTGWGIPGGPTSIADIQSVLVQLQYFGEVPVLVPLSALEGDIITGLKATYTLKDGVYLVHVLYGIGLSTGYTINPTTSTKFIVPLTGTAFDNEWKGVGYVADSANPQVLYKIKAIDNTTGTIELYTAWNTIGTMLKYYDGLTRILVLNCGESNLTKDISNMAISSTGCDHTATVDMMERIMLKLAAQISFSCGNYAKAHNAAILLCDRKSVFQPCTTC